MKYTQYLFSYGTLQEVAVQKELLGRRLLGRKDMLSKFRISKKKIFERYPVIEVTENEKDAVKGTVYKVSYLELFKADAYESSAYKRIQVKLNSGLSAWAYVENSD